MAHFAKLNNENIVERVIVVPNEILNDETGTENESFGIMYCKEFFGENTKWVQTSYNGKFRYRFAGTGHYYDEERDVFRSLNPEYPSWIYNEEIHDWIPPIPVPTHSAFNNSTWIWKEENLQWVPVSRL